MITVKNKSGAGMEGKERLQSKRGATVEKTIFGKIIAGYREKFDLQQNVICEGICSKATYLRTEMEERAADFVVQETLLARVGQDAANFEVILEDEEFELWTERMAIRSAMAGKQFDIVQEKVEAYRRENAHKHKLHEQFCLYYEMKLAEWRGEAAEDICRLAEKALAFTKRIDEQPEIKESLYTPMEMDLLLTLLQHRYQVWENPWKREQCLTKIIEYADVYFSTERQEDIEGRAWIELLKLEEKYGTPEKLLTYVDRAIACFAGGSGILRLAEARFVKAKLLLHISRSEEDGRGHREQCKEECKMVYSIYEAMECDAQRREVERFCEEELQWHITMQMKSSD